MLVNEKDELTPTKVINISDSTMQGNVYGDLFEALYLLELSMENVT